jgi:hypothetical protein
MSPVTFSPTLENSYVGRRIRKFHATETRCRSFFELHSRHATLPDDRQERADPEFAVVWDGNRDAAGVGVALQTI